MQGEPLKPCRATLLSRASLRLMLNATTLLWHLPYFLLGLQILVRLCTCIVLPGFAFGLRLAALHGIDTPSC